MSLPVQIPNRSDADTAESSHALNLQRLADMTQRLQEAVRSAVQYEPGTRPQQLARRLGLSKDVASRVVACCESSGSLEFAYSCPSPATLRKVVEAVRNVRPGPAPERAERVIGEYEAFVQTEFGDQSTMNVLIGAVDPNLGEKAEAVQKQSAFRGMSQLHGLFAEVYLNAAVIARGPEPASRQVVCSEGCLGLRRLRPGPPIVLRAGEIDAKTGRHLAIPGEREITGDWGRALGLGDALNGAEWVVPVNALVGNVAQSRIDRDILGTKRAVNFGVTTLLPPMPIGTAQEAGNQWTGMGLLVPVPAKLLVYDLLVEEGLYGNARPTVLFYDTAMRGPSPLFEPTREFDRLHLRERLEELDPVVGHRSEDVPFMPQLVEFMLRESGFTNRMFRHYRVRQSYPIYGSQVAYALPRPKA